MKLSNRLHQLRKQSGVEAAPQPESSQPGMAARIHRLGRCRPQPRTAADKQRRDQELADRLNGTIVEAGVVLVERRLSVDYWHGEHPLVALFDEDARLPEVEDIAPESMVFMDTETTGLAGGTGTLVFLLGLARLQGDVLVVRQYVLSGFAGEAAMLRLAADWLEGCDTVVTFNGKSFDAPLITTRCRLAGVDDPFADMKHVDLLHPTRRAFGSRWLDCRLGTVERELLQFNRQHDLPGSEAPEAWFEWVHFGHVTRLPGVAQHNYWDLVTLAALLPMLGDIHFNPSEWGADVLSVARSLMRRGDYTGARVLLEDLEAKLDDKGLLELAWLYRREDNWDAACAIWETLAADGDHEAREWLAKYYEHQVKDYRKALAYASQLPEQEPYLHRVERLRKRLAGPLRVV